MKKPVTILDGICGMGKSTKAVKTIKEITGNKNSYSKTDSKVVYVAPYRDECFRMGDMHKKKVPKYSGNGYIPYRKGGEIQYLSKKKFNFGFATTIGVIKERRTVRTSDSFIEIVKSNKNITITHQGLFRLTQAALKLANEHNYHIIIDEAPVAIELVELNKDILTNEYKSLQEAGIIEQGEDKRVHWTASDKGWEFPRYSDLQDKLEVGECYYSHEDGTKVHFMWRMAQEAITSFHSCTVLTYLFEGTILNAYLKLCDIKYRVKDLTRAEALTNPRIKDYHDLIDLYEPRDMDADIFKNKDGVLTATWYKEAATSPEMELDNDGIFIPPVPLELKHPDFDLLSKKTRSFFAQPVKPSKELKAYNNSQLKKHEGAKPNFYTKELKKQLQIEKPSKDERAWTTFKPYKRVLLNDGTKNYNEDNFIVFNKRASNDHAHVKQMAFLVNVHPHYSITTYLSSNGIKLNKDKYATSELLQWVFRSRIRNGEKISLFIASRRMRDLYKAWATRYEEMRFEEADKYVSDEELMINETHFEVKPIK